MLPTDILLIIFSWSDLPELVNICLTCHLFNDLIVQYGWQYYLILHPRPTISIVFPSARSQVRHNHLSDKSWASLERKFFAQPICRPWQGRYQSAMAMNSDYLVFAAACSLYIYKFTNGDRVEFIKTLEVLGPAVGQSAGDNAPTILHDDITNLVFATRNTLVIGRQYGSIESIDLVEKLNDPSISPTLIHSSSFDFHTGAHIESISSSLNNYLTLSSNGKANLITPSGSQSIDLETRGWSSYLPPTSLSFAIFGTTSRFPLVSHSITPCGLSPYPTAILHSKAQTPSDVFRGGSAAYSISQGPPSSPWGASPQIVAAGWFDGVVRIYDLRNPPSSYRIPGAGQPGHTPLHTPVLTMHNPWSDDPIYSLDLGGGGGAHVAAGQARHSVISFWDIRKVMHRHGSKSGWSVHAPGNDHSPVYALKMEGSRVWGVTEKRGFVFDFGPNVTSSTYPELPRGRMDWKQTTRKRDERGYYVTTYDHATGTPLAGETIL